jgi:hypothetical protein
VADQLVLERRGPGGLPEVMGNQKEYWVEWQATPGVYDLRLAQK